MVTNVPIPETLRDAKLFNLNALEMLEYQRQAAAPVIAQLNDAVVTIKTLQDTATENEKVYRGALDKIEGLLRTNRDQAAQIDTLKARIAELEAPPVVIPPVTPAPVPDAFAPIITKERPVNLIMGSIVKDETPGDKQDDITRQAIDEAAAVGCNCVTFFMNEDEIKKHLAPSVIHDPRRNLFMYASDRRLIVGADTIDALLRTIPETPGDERFNAAIDGLIKLGARFLIWNDVDGVNKDGMRVYPPDAIKRGMHRIRRALVEYPDIPVMASLTAAADPAFYKREYGFDWVEQQTFGSIPELQGFMAKPFDVFCIDTQNAVGMNYLQKSRAILVNSTATCLRLYAIFDYDGNDFRKDNFKEEKAEISKTLEYFKEARRVTA